MSLPLPKLDDRTYADLVAEARALIPSLYPPWTDHNPADPGITLIELFAWLTEMLIYRLDRIPDAYLRTFLKLLNPAPPEWEPGPDLKEDLRSTVTELRQRFRVVTAKDYEDLVLAEFAELARAWCVPQRNFAAAEPQEAAPGHVSLIVLPDIGSEPGDPPRPSSDLLRRVEEFLEPRRLLTTRHHVVGPAYAPVRAEVLLALRSGADPGAVHQRALEALTGFLDPLGGGPDGSGWPLGRDVYVSEVYELLEGVAGVDYVPDIALLSECPAPRPWCRAAAALWHDNGDPISLALASHHLPWARFATADLVSATSFVPIRLTIPVTPAAGAVASLVRRWVKEEIRYLFHPLHGGPTGSEPWEITVGTMSSVLNDSTKIHDVGEIALEAPPGCSSGAGATACLRLAAGELADVRATVEIGGG